MGENDLHLVSVLPNGTANPQFGTQGFLKLNSSTLGPTFTSIELGQITFQENGKLLLLVASLTSDGMKSLDVVQVTENGSIDTAFGNQGILNVIRLPLVGRFKSIHSARMGAIAVDSAKRILVTYARVKDSTDDMYVQTVRFTPQFVVDKSFGSDGIASLLFGDSAYPSVIRLQSDGKILIGGSTRGSYHLKDYDTLLNRLSSDFFDRSHYDYFLYRLKPDGSVDY